MPEPDIRFELSELKRAFGITDPKMPDFVMVAPGLAELFTRVIANFLNPRPEEHPSFEKPCPHPARNGQHEVYTDRGKLFCRACGAQ